MKKRQIPSASFSLKRLFISLFVLYFVFAVIFYFLAGYQLHFRASRGNLEFPVAESGTVELVQGTTIEQVFTAKIQRLESVSVQWGTYLRQNTGTAYMELLDLRSGAVLLSQNFDVSALTEGAQLTLSSFSPVEGYYDVPLLLRIYADSQPGSAASPLMSSSVQPDGFSLSINGTPVQGTLCFSASGEDYIWTGLHYWKFVAGFGAVLGVYLTVTYWRWSKGKDGLLVKGIAALQKYRFLIKQLVDRDFKAKYKRSILGVFWSFLNPLLTMIVQYIVFSNLFRFDIPYYTVYLLTGIIIFNYFSESCGMALSSIVGNANLITKVYVPKYIYPLTRILSSLVNLVISMIPLLLVILFSGLLPTKAYPLILFDLICLALFCLGLGMLLASAMVFFRDIQFLWGVLTMLWMYLTPIFYPADILPEQVAWVLGVNPLYYFITFLRTCVMDGVSPEPVLYVQCFLSAMLFLILGTVVFKKTQDKFVLYL